MNTCILAMMHFFHDTLYVNQILHDDFVLMSEAKQT